MVWDVTGCLEVSSRWMANGAVNRLHKLQQKHEQLQALAQRAAKASEEEEVGWDDDEAAPTPRANAKIPESCALSADSIDDSRKGLEGKCIWQGCSPADFDLLQLLSVCAIPDERYHFR